MTDKPAPIVHKGVELPYGMPTDLADRLERMIASYVDNPHCYPFEFGVTLFQEIEGTQGSELFNSIPNYREG